MVQMINQCRITKAQLRIAGKREQNFLNINSLKKEIINAWKAVGKRFLDFFVTSKAKLGGIFLTDSLI